MKKWGFTLVVPLVCLSLVSAIQQSSQYKSRPMLIRKDRPSVYIEFERSGKASPLFEGERDDRIWLRLHNNTQWAIVFCSFTVNNKYGGTGIVYEVKRYQQGLGGDERRSRESASLIESNQIESTKIPQGYRTGDTCTSYSLESGKSVVFSIPRDHLGKNLYLAIEFWPAWENRDNELGNFPQYHVSFGNQELPGSEK